MHSPTSCLDLSGSRGYLGWWEPSGGRGALGQHPARPRPAALAGGGRLSSCPVPTPQSFQQGWGNRGLPEAFGVGRRWARPRSAQQAPREGRPPVRTRHRSGAEPPSSTLTPPPRPSCTRYRSPVRPGARPATGTCPRPPERHCCKKAQAWDGGSGLGRALGNRRRT